MLAGHHFLYGLLLGWGAAIPIGPVNLEIVRRNLRFGSWSGFSFGLGACSADLTYFIILLFGALTILKHPLLLKVIGVLGSFILLWFGISALRLKATTATASASKEALPKNQKIWHHYIQSYLMTLLNPMTILFWSSVGAQLAALSVQGHYAALYAGVGVMLAILSWITALNLVLHFTRHRLPDKTIHYLNYVGGLILIGFSIFGFWHAFK